MNLFQIPSCSVSDSLPSSLDIRSLILDDDSAIECLFKLYQFYELHSEPVSLFDFLRYSCSFSNRLINILEKIM
jgi:hypothetical protein